MKKKSKLRRLYFLLFSLSLTLTLSAQTSITKENNGKRPGDMLMKQLVDVIDAGDAGENVIWNFSNSHTIETHQIVLFCDSDSIEIKEIEPTSIRTFAFRSDSLLMTGYETPLKKIQYSTPVSLLAYPFEYGSSFFVPYSGTGSYCKTLALSTSGTMDVEADGTGTLILTENDTLRNALRVHSIRTGSIEMHLDGDSIGASSPNMKQEIEESYQWYVRGYRYPLFETRTTSYYDNMELVSCVQSAHRFLPDMQQLLDDEQNEEILRADSLAEHLNSSDIIDYNVVVNGGNLKIAYSLSEPANITALLCNHRGMAYRRISCSMPAGENYELNLDCTGLVPDVYILYINVNGKVYSEKVSIF